MYDHIQKALKSYAHAKSFKMFKLLNSGRSVLFEYRINSVLVNCRPFNYYIKKYVIIIIGNT